MSLSSVVVLAGGEAVRGEEGSDDLKEGKAIGKNEFGVVQSTWWSHDKVLSIQVKKATEQEFERARVIAHVNKLIGEYAGKQLPSEKVREALEELRKYKARP